MAFGSIYLLLPILSGAFLDRPIMVLPIPWSDWTQKTENWLPAVETGLSWDLSNVLLGMVLPYFAMLGAFIGLIVTFVLNPILHHAEVLTSWNTGDDTVATLYKNNVNFYFSFTIGIGLAIAAAGLWQVVGRVRRFMGGQGASGDGGTRGQRLEGRGDIKTWIVIACYLATTIIYILVAGFLIDWH